MMLENQAYSAKCVHPQGVNICPASNICNPKHETGGRSALVLFGREIFSSIPEAGVGPWGSAR